ncbi:MAG TPA: CPXCG motif-containing cysteine-rich protein [Sandaracinaceae bacterium LLY-WYZ-13_1]|nr:CPXCG motif-containing cysteine-rich protein [Sandaracinaceae bacterium LLY-WYZ-13_1]
MNDTAEVRCPWCFEPVELYVDPGTRGSFVQDCDVCCRPWQVWVDRDPDTGEPSVTLARAQ